LIAGLLLDFVFVVRISAFNVPGIDRIQVIYLFKRQLQFGLPVNLIQIVGARRMV
jgi:hypothetical protein